MADETADSAAPRLSVCLIARNEQANLPRALKSIRSLADEIVVVDTGSEDKTVDVAESFGAKVGFFEWCDDFAAARNAAVDLAGGDWVFWLDADEALLPGQESLVRNAIAQPDAVIYDVLRQDLRSADDPKAFTTMWQRRLFRRRDDLRFTGRCHPHFGEVLPALLAANPQAVRKSEITMRHWGYLAELRQSKLRRAARLLQLELQDRPGQLYHQIELARTLLLLGDPQADQAVRTAAELLIPHLADPHPPQALAAALLEVLLQWSADDLPAPLTPALLAELAERWFPAAPPLIWRLAVQDLASERYADAEAKFARLVEMGRTGQYDFSTSFDPAIIGDDAMLNLGVACVRQAKLAEAKECFEQLTFSKTLAREARENLAAIKRIAREHAAPGKTRRNRKTKRKRRSR